MALTRLERNQIFRAIAASNLDPAECHLSQSGGAVTITHSSSGSALEFPAAAFSGIGYRVDYNVVDGRNYTAGTSRGGLESVTLMVTEWANEVKEITETPDLWAEMQRSQESIAVIRREDFENTPFTQDEQRHIAAQLQEVKNQLENFALSSQEVSQVGEKLDELVEASHHLRRKDWLIIFITTISPLVADDIVTPGVARHIFTMIINGLIHLFGGGPPQILS